MGSTYVWILMKVQRVISHFSLTMISIAAILSLQNLPIFAEYGLSSVFYLLAATLMFFIPTALVCAELATGWPKRGGVYVWVREALGEKWGFVAIWLQWVENVVWYPTILVFISATLAYIFNPALANNKLYSFVMTIGLFWVLTLCSFRGMRLSSWMSTIAALFGTLIPGLLIIGLGILWFIQGSPMQLVFSWECFWPDLTSMRNLVFLTGVLFSLAGMEMPAVHAEDVYNPHKSYPKAILFSASIICVLSILGSLSIAIVVPQKTISLEAGVMEAFTVFFTAYNLSWCVPIIALLTALGAAGMVSTWIVGPSKGLLAAGKHGDLPKYLQKTNCDNMPVPLLVGQAVIVSILSICFLIMPTVSSSYWILTALTAQLYLLMYCLMFISAIVLRYTHPHIARGYRIPWGNYGIWIVCLIGLGSSLFAIGIGFLPPSDFPEEKTSIYIALLAGGMFVMNALPASFIYLHYQKKT